MNTIKDVSEIQFNCYKDANGSLVPIELGNSLPFQPMRIFYSYGVPSDCTRGNHAHYTTKQVLVCISGDCVVECSDGHDSKRFILDSPNKGICIPEMIWDKIKFGAQNSVLLVFSSTSYNRDDYIEDYEKFKKLRGAVQ